MVEEEIEEEVEETPVETFDVSYSCLRCGTSVLNSELSRFLFVNEFSYLPCLKNTCYTLCNHTSNLSHEQSVYGSLLLLLLKISYHKFHI